MHVIIGFTLHQPLRDYSKIHTAIIGLGKAVKVLDTTYYVISTYTPVQIRDYLQSVVDSNDSIFVTEVKENTWATFNITTSKLLPGA